MTTTITILNMLAMKRFISVALFATICLIGGAANALEGDSNLPVRVESDTMELDFKTGSRELQGNVSIFQGSFELYADKVIAEYNGDALLRATAFGSPAIVKDQPDGDTRIDGEATRIELDRTNNDIILTGDAKLFQDTTDKNGNPMKLNTNGERIVYNLSNETLKVTGGNTSTKSVGGQAPSPPKPKPANKPVATSTPAPAKPAASSENNSATQTTEAANTASNIVGATEGVAEAVASDATVTPAAAEAAPTPQAEVPRSGGRTRLVILPKGGVNKKMQRCGEGDKDDPAYIECD